MANNLNTNPIMLDTFSADVTIGLRTVAVKAITLKSAAAGDMAVFTDNGGVQNVHIANNLAGGSKELPFGGEKGFIFANGLVFNTAASTGLGSGDILMIYLA